MAHLQGMSVETSEIIELGELDNKGWNDYATAQGWSDVKRLS